MVNGFGDEVILSEIEVGSLAPTPALGDLFVSVDSRQNLWRSRSVMSEIVSYSSPLLTMVLIIIRPASVRLYVLRDNLKRCYIFKVLGVVRYQGNTMPDRAGGNPCIVG